MNRSRPAVRDAIKFIHEGGLGKIYMARGLCYKPRPAIGKYPDGPLAPGEKYALTTISTIVRADLRPAVSVEGRLRPVARAGAEASVQPQPLPLQLALALGLRQRRQRQPGAAPVRHRALGSAEAGAPDQDPIGRRLFRRRGVAGDAERADQHLRVRRRQDPRVRHARRVHERRGQRARSATCSTGRRAGCGSRRPARRGNRTSGRRTRRARARTRPTGTTDEPTGLTTTEYPHYQNFVDAIRANDPKVLTCDVLEGHLSSTLPHLGNISYQVGRQLQFDGKSEKFVNDKQADQLLTREYRKGFEIPNSFSTGTHDQANR